MSWVLGNKIWKRTLKSISLYLKSMMKLPTYLRGMKSLLMTNCKLWTIKSWIWISMVLMKKPLKYSPMISRNVGIWWELQDVWWKISNICTHWVKKQINHLILVQTEESTERIILWTETDSQLTAVPKAPNKSWCWSN